MLTPQDLADLTMPTLLVWGREERILPPSHLAFFRDHLPDHAEIEEWPNFGHCGFLEQPTALCNRVIEFARRAAATAKNRSRRSTGLGDHATLRASA
jgi:pimeloyl-ACP methyl ester carboxylesterase